MTGKDICKKFLVICVAFLMSISGVLPQTVIYGYAENDNNQTDELQVQMGTSSDKMVNLDADNYEASLNSADFKINVSGSYPSNATSKQLDITLAYGLTWWDSRDIYNHSRPSYEFIDHTQPWYKNITSLTGSDQNYRKGTDEQNSYHVRSTQKYGNNVGDGTLTIQFNDSLTEFKTTNLSFGTLGLNANIGEDYLESINHPVQVTLSYVLNGELHKSVKNLNHISFTNLPTQTRTASVVSHQYADSKGRIIVAQGGSSNSSMSNWGIYPFPQQGGTFYPYLLKDYYMLYKVPAALQYKQTSQGESRAMLGEPKEISYDSCNGNYSAPDGESVSFASDQKLVEVHMKKGPGTVALTNGYYPFYINWTFPSDSFQDGETVDVELVDANFLYDSSDSYLQAPTNAPKVTYIVTKPEPDVFAANQYDNKKAHNYTGNFSAPMSGAPELNYAQERSNETPAFAIGNRGTGDSNPKTLHFDFDLNNHGGYGVTFMYLPHTTNDAGKDLTVKYRTWNGKDQNTISEVRTKTVHINNDGSGNTFSVTRTDGYKAGIFLKEVEFNIGSIPTQWNPSSWSNYGCLGKGITGVTLTDQVVVSKDNDGIIMRMEAYDQGGDKSDTVSDTRYVNLSGKYFLDDTIANLWSGESPSFVAGEKRRVTYSLVSGNGAGSPDAAARIDKIYVISPYGDEFTNWSVNGSRGYVINVTPKELDTSNMTLPEKYKNAKVYELDFTGITNDDLTTFMKSRTNGGVLKTGGYQPDGKPVTWNDISFQFDWNSSYSDPIGTTDRDLIWVKPFYPTKEDGSPDDSKMARYGSWTRNTFGLPGERADAWFNVSGLVKIQSAQSLGVTVKSSPEYSDELHTWTDKDTYTEIANDGIKYQLVVGNATNTDINNAELYIPIPKKSEQWSNKYQSDSFQYDMELSGLPSFTKGDNSETACQWYYTTETSGTPESDTFTAWHELTNATDLSQVTMLKAALTNVKMQSVQTIDIPLNTTVADRKAAEGFTNKWNTVYVSHMTTATTAESSAQAVAQIKAIQLNGFVWMDANHDGSKDTEESFISGVKMTLHDGESGRAKPVRGIRRAPQDEAASDGTSLTDENGAYSLKTYSTKPGQYIEISLPDGTSITEKQNDSAFDPQTKRYTFETSLTRDSYDGLNCGLIHVPVVTVKKANSKTKALIGEAGFQIKKDGKTVVVNGQTDGSFLIRDKDAGFTIQDLADGTYTLTETKTPLGYNKPEKDVTFTVKNGVISIDENQKASLSDDKKVLTIYNDPGVLLPKTGGFGTTIFIMIGGLLIAGAVTLIVMKRRKDA